MSGNESDVILKRVSVAKVNLEIIERLAENTNTPLSEYLNYLINKAIVEEEKRMKAKSPLYLWKS